MARSLPSLAVCELFQPHGNRLTAAYECMLMIVPRAVTGAASLSFGPRWSGNRRRNRLSSALVSGSLSARVPGYAWPHGLVSTPVVFQCVAVLRFRSTPHWLPAVGGLAHREPALESSFLRCRYGRVPPCWTTSTPSGFITGTTHTSVLF